MDDEPVIDRRREPAAFYEQLLEAIGQAVIVTDTAGTIVLWNAAAERLYGWSRSEALGRNVVELIPPPGDRSQASHILDRLAAGESWSGEFRVRRRDGSEFPALVTDTPVHDGSGQRTHIIGVSTDLTERMALERRFRTGFDSSPTGWAYVDLGGSFTMVNDAFCRIVGRRREDIVGHRPEDLTAPEDLDRATPFPAMLAGAARHLHHQEAVRDGER